MNHTRRPTLFYGFTLAVALIVLFGLASSAYAANYRNRVAQLPITPVNTQSVRIWMNSDTVSGETAGVEYRIGANYTKVYGTYDNTSYLGANWYADIPAQSAGTVVYYQLFTRNEEGVDYGFTEFNWSYTVTDLPPAVVGVDDDYNSSTPGWNYDRFATIQDGFNAVVSGGIINVEAGTYAGDLTLNKAVTLQVTPNASPMPMLQGACGTALLNVTANNVTIRGLNLKVNQTTCLTGIAASGTYDGLTIDANHIESTGTAPGTVFNSYGINLNGAVANPIVITGNVIQRESDTNGASDANSTFGYGIQLTNTYGSIGNNIPGGENTIAAYYAIRSDSAQGPLQISGNTLYGSTVLIAPQGGVLHRFESNICAASISGSTAEASNVFALLEVRNLRDAATSLQVTNNNTFQGFVNFGVFLGRSNNVTVDSNTFEPMLGTDTVTDYRDLHINTKERTLGSDTAATVSNITVTNNTFNGNGLGGVAVELADHQAGATPAFQNITIGAPSIGPGGANYFATTVATYLRLDPLLGNSDTLPMWGTPSCGVVSCTNTIMAPVALNLATPSNFFEVTGGSLLPSAMWNFDQLAQLEDRIVHHIDYAALGVVRTRPDYLLITPASYLPPFTLDARPQRGVEVAQAGDIVHIMPGAYMDTITITQPITVQGAGPSSTTLYPAFTNPDCRTGGSGSLCGGLASNLILVQANDVTVRDLTLDGDNPALTGGVDVGGANVDARNGIIKNNALGNYTDLSIYRTAIRNIYFHGVDANDNTAGLNLTAHDNTVQNVQGEAFSTAGGSSLIHNNDISLSKWAIGVSGGSATVTGNTMQDVSAFNQSGGNLLAYANSIVNATSGLTQTGGAANLKHNWWGTYDITPPGITPADWQARLGASIVVWAEGDGNVMLGSAELSGGTGTAVIVYHLRSTPPFNVWVTGYGDSMCSAYYDFFVENGSGTNTWSVSVPVDSGAGCEDTYNQGKIYSIPYTTTYSTECTPGNRACWDLITTNVITGGGNITVTGLSATALGGTQFVAGSTSGTDPTAITLSAFAAHADRVAWLPLGLALISCAAVLIVWRRRR